MWISAQYTGAQTFYIKHDLYSSSINVTGKWTMYLKENKQNRWVFEMMLSWEGLIQLNFSSAKGKLNPSKTQQTQSQSMSMLLVTNLLFNQSVSMAG